MTELSSTAVLPSALARVDDILSQAAGRALAVFLDYDGTLTPIVSQPEDAVLSEDMRAMLVALAGRVPVAIVSGRDLRDVQRLVGLGEVFYAGSHGFEIVGPSGSTLHRERGREFLPALDAAEHELVAALRHITGVWVERKKYAVAVHYRNVAPADVAEVGETTRRVSIRHPHLRTTGGKKVFELRPDIDWDKGKAVHDLLATIAGDARATMPIYIGDDVTDEDAFRAIAETGVGVVVRDDARPTAARYALDTTEEVLRLLRALFEGTTQGGPK